MIGFKLAVAVPERVCSLTLISATAGHWQVIPLGIKPLWYAFQVRLQICHSLYQPGCLHPAYFCRACERTRQRLEPWSTCASTLAGRP